MRDYGKITPGFWIGKTGRQLRKDSTTQVAAVYLMTAPQANMLGLYYCPVAYIMADTGLSEKEASKGLVKLCELGFCVYDWDAEWVWVKEMARFQVADQLKANDNRVFGIKNDLKNIPNLMIKRQFIHHYSQSFHLDIPDDDDPHPVESASPSEAPSETLRSQEQEQEQEKEKESTAVAVVVVADAPTATTPSLHLVKPPCPYQAIVDLYHEILPELPTCKILTNQRKGLIKQRWTQKPGPSLDKWRDYFSYVRKCPWLMGQVPGSSGRPPFVANLEWLTRPNNFAKVWEGNYETHLPQGGSAHG